MAAAAITFAATIGYLVPRGALEGGFRIDEAHKISETVYLHLLLAGRTSDPLWVAHVVDRTNPPVGKYLLGLGIAIQGHQLPRGPSLSHASRDGSIPPFHSREQSAPLEPLIPAARRTALAATAVAAATLAFALARAFGAVAAAAGTLLFITSFPVEGWGASAVFDPFLALAFASAFPLVISFRPDAPARTAVLQGAIAGTLAALAFQIRFSGLALLAGVFVAAAPLLRAPRRMAAFAVASLAALASVAIAINPFYWAAALGPAVPGELRVPFPARPIARLGFQFEEISMLLARVSGDGQALRSSAEKLRFTAEIAFGDAAGMGLLFGLLAFAGFAPWRARSASRAQRAVMAYATALLLIYVAWLPLPWPRYVLPVMPLLAALGAIGWLWVAEVLVRAIRARSAGLRPLPGDVHSLSREKN